MRNTLPRSVAGNIRSGLHAAGLTQDDLASALGISRISVTRRLTDRVHFDYREIQLAAALINVTPGALFDGVPAPAALAGPTPAADSEPSIRATTGDVE